MKTLLTQSVEEAARIVKMGGVVAFPTETVYGLGANVLDQPAVEKIFEAKQRPADNPLIAHISSTDQIAKLSSKVSEAGRKFIDAFFPGPLTVVVVKSEQVPLIATAGLDTIGIRMPRFQLAREFIEHCGMPLVAPSANLSGRPSPTTWQAVYEDLNGRIDCILQGEPTEIGLESTVVNCTGEWPVLLRKGSVSIEQLQEIVPETSTVAAADGDRERRSPGLRHRHYSPNAGVRLFTRETEVERPSLSAFIGLSKAKFPFGLAVSYANVEDYAKNLFAFFRECDAKRIEYIYCETVPERGIGAALMDRLRRAAEE